MVNIRTETLKSSGPEVKGPTDYPPTLYEVPSFYCKKNTKIVVVTMIKVTLR